MTGSLTTGKLKAGDIIRVKGHVLLQGFKQGQYWKVTYVHEREGNLIYNFIRCSKNGKNYVRTVCWWSFIIDCWVSPSDTPDLNALIKL